MTYEWRHMDTGKLKEHSHWSVPPDFSGRWVRNFSFGIGRVVGAGSSPGRYVTSKKGAK